MNTIQENMEKQVHQLCNPKIQEKENEKEKEKETELQKTRKIKAILITTAFHCTK